MVVYVCGGVWDDCMVDSLWYHFTKDRYLPSKDLLLPKGFVGGRELGGWLVGHDVMNS